MKFKTYNINHSFYGDITLIEGDTGISEHVKHGIIWEPKVVRYFKRHYKKNGDILDIGANIGLHSIALSKIISSNCTVHAFEMQEQMYEILKKNSANENITTYHMGISDKSSYGTYETHLNEGNPGGIGMNSEQDENGDSVRLESIDNLSFENRISLMKIDVEGMELQVLEGAKNTIKKNKPKIICEIAGGCQRENPFAIKQVEKIKDYCKRNRYKMKKITFHDYLLTPKFFGLF